MSTSNSAHAIIDKSFAKQNSLGIPLIISNCKKDDQQSVTYSKKLALFTVDTVIGDRSADKLYSFEVTCRFSKEPVIALSLTVHYNGTVTINKSSDPVLNKPYQCDLGDNAPMGELATQLLKQITANPVNIDPYTAIFLDLLELSQPTGSDSNNIIELKKAKLDQVAVLTAIVTHGIFAIEGSPLRIFADTAKKSLPKPASIPDSFVSEAPTTKAEYKKLLAELGIIFDQNSNMVELTDLYNAAVNNKELVTV